MPAPALRWTEVTTVGDLFVRAAARWPEREAFVVPGARLTYAAVLERAERAARCLLGLGIRPGERVGTLMPTCLHHLDTMIGCAMLGIPVAVFNARFRAHELAYVLHDSDVTAVVKTDLVDQHVDLAGLLRAAAAARPPLLRHLVALGDASPPGFVDDWAFLAGGDNVPVEEVRVARERVLLREEALLIYTSGTTARPKGCVITHEALVRTAIAAAERWELTEDDRFWNPLPMYHMGGIVPLLAHVHSGATYVTHTHFEPAEALRAIAEERCTFIYPTFPTVTQSLLHHPDFPRTDMTRVRLVNDTGDPDSLRRSQAAWPQATVVTLFGMTETGGGVSWGHLADPAEKRFTTGGRPLRGTRVRIVDPETGEDLGAGGRGEILVRGPGLFERYHKDPELTAERLDAGGWFHTGDLGTLDEDGRITYLGRLKDMLKVGGENVAAAEVEAFLATHPAVKLAAVVGIPDPRYLEVPAAFVELLPGAEIGEGALIGHCRGRIASYKVPRHVRFVTEWPLSASKIQKFRLRDALLAELGLEPATRA